MKLSDEVRVSDFKKNCVNEKIMVETLEKFHP